jgi:hypothetical protein
VNPDKISKAGKVLILIGGITLASLYFAWALGLVGPPTAVTMILTGIVILIYTIGEVRRKTYEQGYKDGIDLVLTGVSPNVREVIAASLVGVGDDEE